MTMCCAEQGPLPVHGSKRFPGPRGHERQGARAGENCVGQRHFEAADGVAVTAVVGVIAADFGVAAYCCCMCC